MQWWGLGRGWSRRWRVGGNLPGRGQYVGWAERSKAQQSARWVERWASWRQPHLRLLALAEADLRLHAAFPWHRDLRHLSGHFHSHRSMNQSDRRSHQACVVAVPMLLDVGTLKPKWRSLHAIERRTKLAMRRLGRVEQRPTRGAAEGVLGFLASARPALAIHAPYAAYRRPR